jgi:hypothetical protein
MLSLFLVRQILFDAVLDAYRCLVRGVDLKSRPALCLVRHLRIQESKRIEKLASIGIHLA